MDNIYTYAHTYNFTPILYSKRSIKHCNTETIKIVIILLLLKNTLIYMINLAPHSLHEKQVYPFIRSWVFQMLKDMTEAN